MTKLVSNPEKYSLAISWVEWPVPPTSKYELNRDEINQYMKGKFAEAKRTARKEAVERFGEMDFDFPNFEPTPGERAALDFVKLKEQALVAQAKMEIIDYIYELLLTAEEKPL
ncbi:hypothetical protein [Aneurinibacillus tyrosinisolvens]|uniref:hypothetical protein n=1 Tax=Aneurinibacillus tyrosinisolvens TaxID=1443435 RepID=UPI00063FA6C4|nr:hypothetical protein [Aneurinibacillus tyrosinisolvens]